MEARRAARLESLEPDGGRRTVARFGASIRTSCSMKRGFPSAASSIRIPSMRLLAAPTSPSMSISRRFCSAWGEGISSSRCLRPNDPRASTSSGRPVPTMSTGALRVARSRYSIRSRVAGSARWRSSIARTAGSGCGHRLQHEPNAAVDLLERTDSVLEIEERGEGASGVSVGADPPDKQLPAWPGFASAICRRDPRQLSDEIREGTHRRSLSARRTLGRTPLRSSLGAPRTPKRAETSRSPGRPGSRQAGRSGGGSPGRARVQRF